MSTPRKTAVIIGILFLVAAISSIIGVILYAPILEDANYITKTPVHQTQILWGAAMEIILALSVVGTSIFLYPILKPKHESLALGAVCFRTLESAIIILGILCLVTLTALSHYPKESLQEIASYRAIGNLLLTLHNWTFLFGPNLLLGPSTLMTSYILFKRNLVPKPIAILGLIGGPMIFTCAILVLFGLFQQVSTWGALLAIPVFCYEMSLAIYLIAKGFNPSQSQTPNN